VPGIIERVAIGQRVFLISARIAVMSLAWRR
jgi:hypothetical protein